MCLGSCKGAEDGLCQPSLPRVRTGLSWEDLGASSARRSVAPCCCSLKAHTHTHTLLYSIVAEEEVHWHVGRSRQDLVPVHAGTLIRVSGVSSAQLLPDILDSCGGCQKKLGGLLAHVLACRGACLGHPRAGTTCKIPRACTECV